MSGIVNQPETEKRDKKSPELGCSLFGGLFVISATGLLTVGVYAVLEDGIKFYLMTPLWIGGAVFLGGILTIGIALCGKHSYLKSLVLLVMSVAVFLLCSASTLLLEFVEKDMIFQSSALHPESEEERVWLSSYVIYLMYLVSSIIGLVSSVIEFLYIYCILVAPVRRQQWKAYQPQKQGQDQIQDQIQDPDHHAKTRYIFKPKSLQSDDGEMRCREGEMRCCEAENDLPETGWIYDSDSVDSIRPLKHPLVREGTQLDKAVVEELQHHSTFVEHQHQIRPSPSPPKPPPPPSLPSSHSLTGNATNDLERNDRQRSTARSLERYPIPRKYSGRCSLKQGSRRRKSGRNHPFLSNQQRSTSGQQTDIEQHRQTGGGTKHQAVSPIHHQGEVGTFGQPMDAALSRQSEGYALEDQEAKPYQHKLSGSGNDHLLPMTAAHSQAEMDSRHQPRDLDQQHCHSSAETPDHPPKSVQRPQSNTCPSKPMRHHKRGQGTMAQPRDPAKFKPSGSDTNVQPSNTGHHGNMSSEKGASNQHQQLLNEVGTKAHWHQNECGIQDSQQFISRYNHGRNPGNHDQAPMPHQYQQSSTSTSSRPSVLSCQKRISIEDQPSSPTDAPPTVECAHALPRRRSSRVHRRILEVQEKLRLGQECLDDNVEDYQYNDDATFQITSQDDVDHLQPRLAPVNLQENPVQDYYVTSTRL